MSKEAYLCGAGVWLKTQRPPRGESERQPLRDPDGPALRRVTINEQVSCRAVAICLTPQPVSVCVCLWVCMCGPVEVWVCEPVETWVYGSVSLFVMVSICLCLCASRRVAFSDCVCTASALAEEQRICRL